MLQKHHYIENCLKPKKDTLNLGIESKVISIQKGPLIKIMSSLLSYKK